MSSWGTGGLGESDIALLPRAEPCPRGLNSSWAALDGHWDRHLLALEGHAPGVFMEQPPTVYAETEVIQILLATNS